MRNLKQQFPMSEKIYYFDSAAASLKPLLMIDRITEYYKEYGISTRTWDSKIGQYLNSEMDRLRTRIANYVNTNLNDSLVIFNSGTTQGLNDIITMVSALLTDQDEIILSSSNHNSNLVPWLNQSNKIGFKINVSENPISLINDKTKVISVSQSSNNFDNEFDFDELSKVCKSKGIILINDAAQAIVHEQVDMNKSDAIVFSANKLYGPTGLGFLIINKALANKLKPSRQGGGTTNDVQKNNEELIISTKTNVDAFEPGTLNIAAIYGMLGSLDFLDMYPVISEQIRIGEISDYFVKQFKKRIKHKGKLIQSNNKSIILFSFNDFHAQDIATYLAQKDIYVRQGKFCAHLNFNKYKNNSFVRVSFGVYNTIEDVDFLIDTLEQGGDFLVI